MSSPELSVWRSLLAELTAGRPAALVAVVAHRGSSPGRTGWLMAVGADGWLGGTTGGGPAEREVVRAAVALLARRTSTPQFVTQTHRSDAGTASGLICGGEQRLVLAPLAASTVRDITSLVELLVRGEAASWQLRPDGWNLLAGLDDRGPEPSTTTPDGWRPLAGSPPPAFDDLGVWPGDWSYRQRSGPTHRVYLVGAGHVGAALARVLVPLGFGVTVVDDRPGAAARLSGLAHRTVELPYPRLAELVRPGSYVAVVAYDDEQSRTALAALAEVPLGYLGVLGSRARLAELPSPGPRAPMGLPIGSHTPEEIAISVAAELVSLRSADR